MAERVLKDRHPLPQRLVGGGAQQQRAGGDRAEVGAFVGQHEPAPSPSPEARRKALAAAHELLMTEGFGRLSVEAVAARAWVEKPTLRRRRANASERAPPTCAPRRKLTDLAYAAATLLGAAPQPV